MSFAYTNAYVGPFCVSLSRGKPGDIQKFRFPVPYQSVDQLGQGLLITEGKLSLAWSSGSQYDGEMGPGDSFALDSPTRPTVLNEDLTLGALQPSSFLCVSAVGIEQKVHLDRYTLSPGERIEAERYTLVAVTGEDAIVSVNGRPQQKGARLLYARSGELEIVAHARSIIGKFSFR